MKKHLWGCLEKDFKKDSEKKRSFQEVVSRTVSAMPKGECENLSAAAACSHMGSVFVVRAVLKAGPAS